MNSLLNNLFRLEKQRVKESSLNKNSTKSCDQLQGESFELESQQFDTIDSEDSISTQEYPFNYRDIDYLRMALIRLLPLKQKNICILKDQSILKGSAKLCQKLLKKMKNQLENYTIDIIQVQRAEDIDLIEYHLDPIYQSTIFRTNFIELAARELSNFYGFDKSIEDIASKMKKQKMSLIRYLKRKDLNCVREIKLIVKESRKAEKFQQRLIFREILEPSIVILPFQNIKLKLEQKVAKTKIIQQYELQQNQLQSEELTNCLEKYSGLSLDEILFEKKKKQGKIKHIISLISKTNLSQSEQLEKTKIFNITINILKRYSIINQGANLITQQQIKISDPFIGRKIVQFLKTLSNQPEFKQVKFYSMIDQNLHVIKLNGRASSLKSLNKQITELTEEIRENKLAYTQMINLKQKQILINQQFIDKIYQNYNVQLQTTENILQCKIILNNQNEFFKRKTIKIKKSKTLDYAPIESVIIFRSVAQMEKINSYCIKTFKNYLKKQRQVTVFVEKERKYTLTIKTGLSTQNLLKEAFNLAKKSNSIVMLMPSANKQAFVLEIAKTLLESNQYQLSQLQILLLQPDEAIDIKQAIGIKEFQKQSEKSHKNHPQIRYFTTENNQKSYYSEQLSMKIQEAVKKGQKIVILNNQDLKIDQITHKFVKQSSTLVHLQSNCSVSVIFNLNNKVSFDIKGKYIELPNEQASKIFKSMQINLSEAELSVGAYEIKLDSMQEINLFNGASKNLSKEFLLNDENKATDLNKMQTFYDVKIGELSYHYSKKSSVIDCLPKIAEYVNNLLTANTKIACFSLQNVHNITQKQMKNLQKEVEEDESVQFTYNSEDKIITIKLYDEQGTKNIEKYLQKLETTYSRANDRVKYPDIWQPQNSDIEEFIVSQQSAQFSKVQEIFQVGKIKMLIRIQNKIIYKKYYEEGLFLENLNGGIPVKKMKLFHGTRMLNPEQIYKDKYQSFNINYSNESNLLGKGIYFSESSKYSDDYKHIEKINMRSMLLCQVYVGKSQKCLQHDRTIKDTVYRDQLNKIRYESMSDKLNNSNIYVVYKSRRAYPLYLIKY